MNRTEIKEVLNNMPDLPGGSSIVIGITMPELPNLDMFTGDEEAAIRAAAYIEDVTGCQVTVHLSSHSGVKFYPVQVRPDAASIARDELMHRFTS